MFVESGANDNFIDTSLFKQSLSWNPWHPQTVNARDGRGLALITHHNVPITLIISGNHRECIQLFINPSPCSPVVLGLPWLWPHNPHIDWTTATISSWIPFCHTDCFHSATPTDKITALPVSKPPNLSLVPPVYHDLAQVFSKERALSLPPHCLYDCGIDLLPGAPLPSSHLYNLSHTSGRQWRTISTAARLQAQSVPPHLPSEQHFSLWVKRMAHYDPVSITED